MPEFQARGVRVAVLSVDPPEVSQAHREKLGVSFTFLADTNALVLKRYDLLHAGGGPGGSDIAKPAEFLIDSEGVIRWRNLTRNSTYRARPGAALLAAEKLPAASK